MPFFPYIPTFFIIGSKVVKNIKQQGEKQKYMLWGNIYIARVCIYAIEIFQEMFFTFFTTVLPTDKPHKIGICGRKRGSKGSKGVVKVVKDAGHFEGGLWSNDCGYKKGETPYTQCDGRR